MERITLRYHGEGRWTANSFFVMPQARPTSPPPRGDAGEEDDAALAGAQCLVIGHAPYDGFQEANIVEIVFENGELVLGFRFNYNAF